MTHHQKTANGFCPKPFDAGHALTFTVREIYEGAGEFLSQYHDLHAACQAFGRARKLASYVELRDTSGNVIADYVRRHRH